jgi:1-deoxy-D-xylulose-5-phosphate reductoisomerase
MRIPIAYALGEGRRLPLPFGSADLARIGALTFREPDLSRFPALRLAYEALNTGDSALITFNAANEVASAAFAEGRIAFTSIPDLVEEALQRHTVVKEVDSLEGIWEIHHAAREFVEGRLRRSNDF